MTCVSEFSHRVSIRELCGVSVTGPAGGREQLLAAAVKLLQHPCTTIIR